MSRESLFSPRKENGAWAAVHLPVQTNRTAKSPTYTSSPRTPEPKSVWIFLITDQPVPACLVRILLLRAGIESNPGPITYYCSVCSLILHPSVQCRKCSEWVHFRKVNNCSRLIKKKEWPTYICPTCLDDPFPTQPAPPPSSSPL